jgi:XTP/dITP diphosphohydrolase
MAGNFGQCDQIQQRWSVLRAVAIVVATNNSGKLKEIRRLFAKDVELLTLADLGHFDELKEDQNTIEGNAVQKAFFIYNKYGRPCFADDSGLEVNALGGAPGVYSATYAGPQRNHEENIHLLLKNLQGMADRSARFKTVIAYCDTNGSLTLFEGVLLGKIISERRGTEGFGYDPIFQPDGFLKTLAEMPLEEKNSISHRSRAIQSMISSL